MEASAHDLVQNCELLSPQVHRLIIDTCPVVPEASSVVAATSRLLPPDIPLKHSGGHHTANMPTLRFDSCPNQAGLLGRRIRRWNFDAAEDGVKDQHCRAYATIVSRVTIPDGLGHVDSLAFFRAETKERRGSEVRAPHRVWC